MFRSAFGFFTSEEGHLQSLTGLLNFACSVIVPGRAFLRRLIDLTVGIQSPHHLIRLSKDVKEDLKVWLSFLSNFNGRSGRNLVLFF